MPMPFPLTTSGYWNECFSFRVYSGMENSPGRCHLTNEKDFIMLSFLDYLHVVSSTRVDTELSISINRVEIQIDGSFIRNLIPQ